MPASQDRTWLDVLRQHVQTKPCVILRLDESDSGLLHASRRGLNEFTLARAHDLCADIKTPTICLIFGKLSEWATPEKIEHFAYIGLVSSRSPVTTLETRIKIKRAVSMAPDTEQAMSALLNGTAHATQLQKKLQSSADLLVLSPKLSGALIDALVAIPANQGPIRAVAESLTAPKRYTNFSAVQEDAVQTALKAFGLAASDRASRIELIDSQSTALARVPLMEDSVTNPVRPGVSAVGLAGAAPRLVSSRVHAALIPDASGPLGLRAPLAVEAVECVGGGLAVPFNVPRRSRRQGLRVPGTLASWRPSATPDCCAASCSSGSGQFRPIRTGARSCRNFLFLSILPFSFAMSRATTVRPTPTRCYRRRNVCSPGRCAAAKR